MDISWATQTDIGNLRDENQDYVFANEEFFIVADGLGGHQGSSQASKLATETLAESLLSPKKDLKNITQAIKKANQAVYETSLDNLELAGMGTTLCVLCISQTHDTFLVGNVGDSRLYEFNEEKGKLTQITQDHNLAHGLSWRQKRSNTNLHHQLTRAIGTNKEVEVDSWELEITPFNKLYLLCTDGLHGELSDKEISRLLNKIPKYSTQYSERILRTQELQAGCDALVEAALQAGGSDNISIILVDVKDF